MRLFIYILLMTKCLCEEQGNNYFDVNDRVSCASCVDSNEMIRYLYLGNKNIDIQSRRCQIWNTVTRPYRKDERLTLELTAHHSSCRNIRLEESRFRKSYIRPTSDGIEDGKKGPWCFVRVQREGFPYEPSPCFTACKGRIAVPTKENKIFGYGLTLPLINYNRALFDPIERYFQSYEWGDPTYYTWKPSRDQYSSEYFRIRDQIFYGALLALVIVIIWCMACIYLRKKAVSSRRRRERAIEMLFKQKRNILQGVLSRPAPS